MMTPDNVAKSIFEVINLSINDNFMIEEFQIRPQGGDL